MNIEYVRIMRKSEISIHIENLSRLYTSKNENSLKYLSTIKRELFREYENVNNKIIDNYNAELKEYLNKLNAWETKTCLGCNAKLNMISSDFGTFWGCPDFKNKSVEHSKFSINQGEYLKQRKNTLYPRINRDWVTDIKKKLNIPSHISATNILDFFEFHGFEDLREKYNYKTTKESISGYIIGNRESKKEEKIIYEKLKEKKFDKLLNQYYLKYKLVDSPKENIAILDVVASINDKVYVIEIKRTLNDIKEEQLSLYTDLIKFLLHDKKDNRIVVPLFCIFNRGDYDLKYFKPNNKFIYFDEINDIIF